MHNFPSLPPARERGEGEGDARLGGLRQEGERRAQEGDQGDRGGQVNYNVDCMQSLLPDRRTHLVTKINQSSSSLNVNTRSIFYKGCSKMLHMTNP